MRIEEIAYHLHSEANLPAGTFFVTNIEGHLVEIRVMRNRADMERPPVKVEIPEPEVGKEEIVEEPLQNGANEP